MKNYIRITCSIILLICISIFQLNAIEKPEIKFGQEQLLIIELNDWTTSMLTLEILDNDGETVYVDIIEEKNISFKEYDLKDLSIGKYHIVLYGNKKRTIAKFAKGLDGLQMLEGNNLDIFNPSIKISRRKVDFDYRAYGEDVRLTIVGSNGIAYTTLYSKELFINKKIKIANLPSGNFTLIVNSESQNKMISFNR